MKKNSSIIKTQVPGGWEIRGYTAPIRDALIDGGAVWKPTKVRWFCAGDALPKGIRDAIHGLSQLTEPGTPENAPGASPQAAANHEATPVSKAPAALEAPPAAIESRGKFGGIRTGVQPSRYQPKSGGRVSPVRQQYLDIKAQYPDYILFFRLGDFYETFDRDAEIVAQELGLVLTSRPVNRNERVSMAGVPHQTLEEYVARLIEKGYHVAVAEQTHEPDGRGLVGREVTRTLTPDSHDRMAGVIAAVLA